MMSRSLYLSGGMILLLLAAGCGVNTGVSYRIPGTGVSVGASAPLDRVGKVDSAENAVYRQIELDSEPAGGRVLVNGRLVGATPMTVTLPFKKGFMGSPKGMVQVLVEKKGYLPQGVDLFPRGKNVALSPEGDPVRKVTIKLTKE
ncbi:MAG TPA: PEGA domain-containing protein [Candidatus Sumerlaeota bacterium]|nr:MAG: PEGA domain protein [candidate division BRC1 bacterium ADurb.BinA292]HOE96209.1 PEGA domain-containing protein [Candidatus Sumerlaeota bacterium]HOR27569.1 PEGA domain-containing protein [Candidatus Sumerlaeota bacterium]HPK02060.1 PEGA domain-containing protein [Candidatus Sumerlaeota bacterium]